MIQHSHLIICMRGCSLQAWQHPCIQDEPIGWRRRATIIHGERGEANRHGNREYEVASPNNSCWGLITLHANKYTCMPCWKLPTSEKTNFKWDGWKRRFELQEHKTVRASRGVIMSASSTQSTLHRYSPGQVSRITNTHLVKCPTAATLTSSNVHCYNAHLIQCPTAIMLTWFNAPLL